MEITSLRQLQYFVAVATTGSFTAAAERLNVSQPAIGVQVKQLEDRLGITLFERHSRGVSLTNAGQIYLSYVEDALDKLTEAHHALEGLRKGEPALVRMGVTPTIERSLLPRLFLQSELPEIGIRMMLSEGLSETHFQRILDGRLDCAFCYDPPPDSGVVMNPLYREDLYLVGPPEVVGTSTEPIEFRALENMPLVLSPHPNRLRSHIEDAAARTGFSIEPAVEFSLAGLKREFLLRYGYCAVSPYGLFVADIASGRLVGRLVVKPRVSRTMYFVVSRKIPALVAQRLNTVIRDLIEGTLDDGTMKWTRLD